MTQLFTTDKRRCSKLLVILEIRQLLFTSYRSSNLLVKQHIFHFMKIPTKKLFGLIPIINLDINQKQKEQN